MEKLVVMLPPLHVGGGEARLFSENKEVIIRVIRGKNIFISGGYKKLSPNDLSRFDDVFYHNLFPRTCGFIDSSDNSHSLQCFFPRRYYRM
jgi:hypothetical protein